MDASTNKEYELKSFSRKTMFLVIAAGLCAQSAFASETDANAYPALRASAHLRDNEEATFAAAVAARAAGDYEQSIRLLETLLENNPSLSRARAELAVAYFRLMNFDAAKREINKVMADPNTPDGVRNSMAAFIAIIAKEGRQHVFAPSANIGFGHDSNINAGVRADTIQAGGLTLQIDPSAKPRSANYVSVGASLNHRYMAEDRVDFGGDKLAFLWQSGASYFNQAYQGEGNGKFDLDLISLSTGPALINPGKWRANIALQYDGISLGQTHVASYTGVAPSVTFIVRESTEVTFDGMLQSRDFNDDLSARDSVYRNIGAAVAHKYLEGKAASFAGVKAFSENAREDRFSNQGEEVYIGATYRPVPALSLFVRVGEKHSRYDGVEPLFNEARNERERRESVGFSYKLPNCPAAAWMISGTLSGTQNRSNIDIYTYNRTQAGLVLSAQF